MDLFETISTAAVGDTITLGAATIERQHLTIAAQVAIAKQLVNVLASGSATTLAEALVLGLDALIGCAEVILTDYDPAGFDADTFRAQTDISLPELLVLVVGQVVVDRNESVIQAFGNLGTAAALTAAIAHSEATA